MEICFCIDNNFLNPCLAAIRSIKANASREKVAVHIIGMELTNESVNSLELLDGDNLKVKVYESQGNKDYQGLMAKGHISKAAYVRFEIPVLLKDIKRVIYLDADLIVNDSLEELWNFDISDYMVAAVENPFFTRHDSLWMDKDAKYFNSGVMLLNLDVIRSKRLMEKSLEHKKRPDNQDVFHDQDALNAIINGKWKMLPLKFNLQTIYLRKARELHQIKDEILSAYKKPTIIHYSSGAKPWEFADPHPLRGVFLTYYKGPILRPNSIISYCKAIIKWLYLKVFYYYQLK
jgi:lipopolysaccharide biosynthesis glycosyltransferase